ncbi:WxcM-like domain-containing protein [Halanaerobium sp. ST460_2HS_T2]|uniref:WxcM-like domain-containing protein n=1 Tax=Halanaerobium sp. ST460_2HS_T2 TaxID=2183914 RepID=UPI000DF13EE1|nr:WxcM-like domain-containing protein [Halanaerobium sp. ST460_2HS_T2]RCW56524.1 WxcM-like protein [Halanaerobium sp. ST460_2HS_T2]
MRKREELIEIKSYTEEGYQPVIDFNSWRVAVLNYCEELLVENIDKMQKHNQTDEVFILLKGECTLFLAEGKEEIENIYAQKMEPFKLYNIKKSVWHTHTLSKEAMVLIVENQDTDLSNSPEIDLNQNQQQRLVELSQNLS